MRPIATMLGADEVLASQAAVDDDGCFTGEVTHFNQAQGKADACEQLARTRGWDLSQCSAYSDSVSDAPLLRLVGHPYAVNPDRALREMAERAALNAPIQGSAADIVKIAMINVVDALSEAGLKSRLLVQIHDELLVEVAPGEAAAVEAIVRDKMATPVELSVPLDVAVGVGRSWQLAAH